MHEINADEKWPFGCYGAVCGRKLSGDRSDMQCVRKLLENRGLILKRMNFAKIHADESAQNLDFSIGPHRQ
jgi:hypothetical protein